MSTGFPRRTFLRTVGAASALAGVGDFGFLSRLPPVSAAEAKLDARAVQFHPEIEPVVRLIEETPREKLIEEIASRIKRGLNYRDTLAALLLAGIRNIKPRPVGFKFHAVMVVHSAHLASMASPDSDRWLPILWALDNFKSSQAQDVREGDWTLGVVDEAAVPPSHQARRAFVEAMERWDEAGADAAATALARGAGGAEIFELLCRYGARDFHNIGHKAIYVANGWRTLQVIGWRHAEPVLRSLAFALLAHDGSNPLTSDAVVYRPWRVNQELAPKIRADWQTGQLDSAATAEMLKALRQASETEASKLAVELLNRGVAPQSIWDALFDAAGEMLMRQPGIATLHSVTATNALHYAYQHCGQDETRRLLLLQNASFLPLYRARMNNPKQHDIDELQPLAPSGKPDDAVAEIFADISSDRLTAARKALAYLKQNPDPRPLIDAAQRLVFMKGTDSHDYKFSSAVLEDYRHVSPQWRERFLASSLFYLRGAGAPDNRLVSRIRQALNA